VVRAALRVSSTDAARSTYSEMVEAKQESFIRFLKLEKGEMAEQN
jgi:hypothetical protein